MQAALALILQQPMLAATATEGSCCFGLTSCAEKTSHPLNCPDISACQTQSNCLGPCSSKQQALWCPPTPPGPPPAPFVPSTENLTVYRITPQNYTGVENMNTGDAAGDAFFGLYELAIPILCADPRMSGMVTCTNVPILSIPDFNVYQQSRIEVDTRFGEYNECNPDPSSGIFKCTSRDHSVNLPPQCAGFQATEGYCLDGVPASVQKGSIAECCATATQRKASLWQYYQGNSSCEIHTNYVGGSPCGDAILGSPAQGKCWYDNSQWAREFAGVCSREQCECDTITTKSVGREFLKDTMGRGGGGKSAPPACVAAIKQACGADSGDQAKCQKCLETHAAKLELACGKAFQAGAIEVCYGGGGAGGASIFNFISPLANILNGTWYSTQKSGECLNGAQPGNGECWWRYVETTRVVNSTCVNNNVINGVKAQNPACWSACPQPANMSSSCWVECLFHTLVGEPPSASLPSGRPPMTKAQIVEPFERSFATNDPAEGGCVDWHPQQ